MPSPAPGLASSTCTIPTRSYTPVHRYYNARLIERSEQTRCGRLSIQITALPSGYHDGEDGDVSFDLPRVHQQGSPQRGRAGGPQRVAQHDRRTRGRAGVEVRDDGQGDARGQRERRRRVVRCTRARIHTSRRRHRQQTQKQQHTYATTTPYNCCCHYRPHTACILTHPCAGS